MSTKDITDMEVCEAFHDSRLQQRMHADDLESVIDILSRVTHQPLKVCRCAVERARKRGLIANNNLTQKGRAFLQGNGA